MKENTVKVTLVLNNGDQLNGFVNIIEYRRFSDFIENHPGQHINLFNVTMEDHSSASIADFLVVPKRNVLYYKPFDGESVKKIEL